MLPVRDVPVAPGRSMPDSAGRLARQTSNEARLVDRLFATRRIGVWARYSSSVVAGGKNKRNATRCQYVGDRIHALVPKIDVEHGAVETPTLILDQRQCLRNRASRSHHFRTQQLK